MKNPEDWMRVCLPDREDAKPRSIYLDKDPQRVDSDSWWASVLANDRKQWNMSKLIDKFYHDQHTVRCRKCGKSMEIPNLMHSEVRGRVLSPYCASFTVFVVQWMTHHGWHVRNLGLHDFHPYFCPDCWEDGTPEYEAKDYGKQWCEQALEYLSNNKD